MKSKEELLGELFRLGVSDHEIISEIIKRKGSCLRDSIVRNKIITESLEKIDKRIKEIDYILNFDIVSAIVDINKDFKSLIEINKGKNELEDLKKRQLELESLKKRQIEVNEIKKYDAVSLIKEKIDLETEQSMLINEIYSRPSMT